MAKYVLFSAVSGTVYLNGAAVAEARIERKYYWRWSNERASDETTTDAQGRFSLKQIEASSMSAWLPHEPYVEQSILVHYRGQQYEVWGYDKRNYSTNGELDGKAIKLRIELTLDLKRFGDPQYFGRAVGRFTFEP